MLVVVLDIEVSGCLNVRHSLFLLLSLPPSSSSFPLSLLSSLLSLLLPPSPAGLLARSSSRARPLPSAGRPPACRRLQATLGLRVGGGTGKQRMTTGARQSTRTTARYRSSERRTDAAAQRGSSHHGHRHRTLRRRGGGRRRLGGQRVVGQHDGCARPTCDAVPRIQGARAGNDEPAQLRTADRGRDDRDGAQRLERDVRNITLAISPSFDVVNAKGVSVWNNCDIDDRPGACPMYVVLKVALKPGQRFGTHSALGRAIRRGARASARRALRRDRPVLRRQCG